MRVTEKMDRLIRLKAQAAGMTITDYLEFCALDKTIVNFENFKDLLIELKRISNNLNQLTVLAHQGRIQTVDLSETRRALSAVTELVSRALRR